MIHCYDVIDRNGMWKDRRQAMKQALIAPQFGLAASRVAEEVRASPETQATANVVAYSGSAAFRSTTGPTVVVKTVKRRKLEIGAEANGAGAQQDTFMSGAPDGDTKGPKAPKVFLVMPQRPSAPQEDGASEPSQPLIADERVAAEPSDVASTSRTSSPTVPRRKRRRDPLTEPVLVRHVVFEKPEAEVAPQPRQQLEASSTDRVDYKTACHALQELATKLDAMARAQQLLAELDLMCSRHPSRAKIES